MSCFYHDLYKKGKHTYRLEYFPITLGRAERVRLTFAACQVEFEDIQSTAFGEYKAQGKVLPWGHFPLLKVSFVLFFLLLFHCSYPINLQVDGGVENGGQNLSNSIALQWYVAAEEAPHLVPKTPLDQHLALSVAMTTEDRYMTFVKWAFGKKS